MGNQNWLGFSVGIEIDLFCCAGGRRWFCFLCAGQKYLVFSVLIDWLGFCVGDLSWLGFCLLAENHLVFSVSIELDFVFLWVVEINLDLIVGDRTWGWSKWTWVYAGRKSFGFSVSIELDFVFVWVVEIDLISSWGVELDLGFVWVVYIDLGVVCGRKITWF